MRNLVVFVDKQVFHYYYIPIGGMGMMHSFGMIFMLAWLIVPVLIILGVTGAVRRYFSKSGGTRLEADNQSNLESRVFRIAQKYKGILTVSDLVIESGLPAKKAEAVLQNMCDSVHTRMDVLDDGSVQYVFPEIEKRGNTGHDG